MGEGKLQQGNDEAQENLWQVCRIFSQKTTGQLALRDIKSTEIFPATNVLQVVSTSFYHGNLRYPKLLGGVALGGGTLDSHDFRNLRWNSLRKGRIQFHHEYSEYSEYQTGEAFHHFEEKIHRHGKKRALRALHVLVYHSGLMGFASGPSIL